MPKRLRGKRADFDDDYDDEGDYPSPILHETEDGPIASGVLDADGTMIYYLVSKEPLGYLAFDDTDQLRPRDWLHPKVERPSQELHQSSPLEE